ncbi:MAG: ABC transporter ATP-binding protein [Elusimicrobia bacterium]|nr:ABC transporter ATP-binding protein [Elusimicrobiota bacterium]
MNSKISARGLTKVFEDTGVKALDGVDFDVADGEFVCLLGPSGCGKTTLLELLAGLTAATSGEAVLTRRGRAPACMVFQDLALFPWLNVEENVGAGLRFQGVPAPERKRRASGMLDRFRIADAARLYPHQLSGGMAQRAALARAFVCEPEILLMDEPLGRLDASTRRLLQEEFIALWEADRKTVVFVTHSIEEALLLADRVLVMTARPGRIKASMPVPFARPRGPATCRAPGFFEAEQSLWSLLEGETRRTLDDKEPA